MTRWVPLLALAAITAAAIALGGHVAFVASDAAILGIAASGLALVVARMGLVSLGHGAFFGLGAYTSALLVKDAGVPALLGLIGAVIVATLYGAIVGPLALRTRGLGFVMVTLAFGELVRVVAQQAVGLTGGDTGLSGVPPLPWAANARIGLGVLFVVVVTMLQAGRWLIGTTLGRSIDAARQDEAKARALGFPVDRSRTIVFVLSASVSGLAGALFAHHTSFVSPELLSWITSGELLVMVLLGGGRTLTGAALGAYALTFLEDTVVARTDLWELVLGTVFVLVVVSGWLHRPRRAVAA